MKKFFAHRYTVWTVNGIVSCRVVLRKLLLAVALETSARLHPLIGFNKLIVVVCVGFKLTAVNTVDLVAINRRKHT